MLSQLKVSGYFSHCFFFCFFFKIFFLNQFEPLSLSAEQVTFSFTRSIFKKEDKGRRIVDNLCNLVGAGGDHAR